MPALAVVGDVQGEGRARSSRRTCMRLMNASFIVAAFRFHVADEVKFPTTQHRIQADKFRCVLAIF